MEARGYYVLVLGGVSAVLMIALKKQNEQKARKARKEQMLTDYPEIINKFALLLSTGMTTKNVWERIVKNYEEQKICTGERAAYEEMRYTCNEMQSGITEAEAYERFGKRCGISVYMKFGALLAQNLKKGTKGMTDLLRNESDQAFENRKAERSDWVRGRNKTSCANVWNACNCTCHRDCSGIFIHAVIRMYEVTGGEGI